MDKKQHPAHTGGGRPMTLPDRHTMLDDPGPHGPKYTATMFDEIVSLDSDKMREFGFPSQNTIEWLKAKKPAALDALAQVFTFPEPTPKEPTPFQPMSEYTDGEWQFFLSTLNRHSRRRMAKFARSAKVRRGK